jgi:TRAP-type C4-dicarboxylate transport system permease small subunit
MKSIVKVIIFVLCAILLLWFGTNILNLAWTGDYPLYIKLIDTAFVAFEYGMAYKACRLAVEIIVKENEKR